MVPEKKLGLSLSGGGYRAAAFHLGTLKKLHELNILSKVDVLSTISGGSITGACYCLNHKDFEGFEKNMREALQTKNVIKSVLRSFSFVKLLLYVLLFLGISGWLTFSSWPWLAVPVLGVMIWLLVRYQFVLFPVSLEIEKAYDKFFYRKAALKDLADRPVLAIGATNLQTARPFTFSKEMMEDSAYVFMQPPVRFRNGDFPLARAVTASSCVPFAFTPVGISKDFFEDPEDMQRVNPKLVDGGVYDNQGIHKITQKKSFYACDTIITSDAGNKLPFRGSYNNTIILLIRTMDVFMARIKNFQMVQNLYENIDMACREIAYLSLGWDLEECIPGFVKNLAGGKITKEVTDAHKIPPEWVGDPMQYRKEIMDLLEKNVNYPEILAHNLTPEELQTARTVSTNLTPLSQKQVYCLMQQAANLTELQVKLYCPALII